MVVLGIGMGMSIGSSSIEGSFMSTPSMPGIMSLSMQLSS